MDQSSIPQDRRDLRFRVNVNNDTILNRSTKVTILFWYSDAESNVNLKSLHECTLEPGVFISICV